MNSRGLVIIEIIVALSVILTAFIGFLTLQTVTIKLRRQSIARIQATYLAQEAIEAVRSIREESQWGNLLGTCDNQGANCYLKYNSGANGFYWTLSAQSSDAETLNLDGREFNLTLKFFEAYRGSNGNICGYFSSIAGCDTPTADPNVLMVRAMVKWGSPIKQVKIETYITNWKDSL